MKLKCLLDTNTFSDIVRGNANVERRLSVIPPSMVGISSVTVKEIEYGRSRCPEQVTRRAAAIDSLLRRIDAVPFDVDVAYVTGRLRASLSRAGTPIGPYDVMIAGTALVHGLILVTANTREFSRVSGLQLEDWRVPSAEVRESAAVYRVKVKSRWGIPAAA
jgi:tRNA(fMet)-specific endonuclease VapC